MGVERDKEESGRSVRWGIEERKNELLPSVTIDKGGYFLPNFTARLSFSFAASRKKHESFLTLVFFKLSC
jgi:hypothetical protein